MLRGFGNARSAPLYPRLPLLRDQNVIISSVASLLRNGSDIMTSGVEPFGTAAPMFSSSLNVRGPEIDVPFPGHLGAISDTGEHVFFPELRVLFQDLLHCGATGQKTESQRNPKMLRSPADLAVLEVHIVPAERQD